MSSNPPSRVPVTPAVAYGVGIFGTGILSFISYYSIKAWDFCRRRRPHVSRQNSDLIAPAALPLTKDDEIASLTQKLSDAEGRCKTIEEELRLLKLEARKANGRVTVLEGDLAHSRLRANTLTEQIGRMEQEIGGCRDELTRMQQRYEQTVSLLNAKTAELEASQAFLTKDNQVAGADVTKLVETLNSDILQLAASISESFSFDANRSGDLSAFEDGNEEKDILAEVEEVLGPRMTNLLRHSGHHEDPILVQMALQSSMCAFSNFVIGSWFFHTIDTEQLLEEIYEQIRHCEDQSVSGRWRILTRTYAQSIYPRSTHDLSTYFTESFSNILIASGIQNHTPTAIREVLGGPLWSERLSKLVDSCVGLNKLFGIGSTSSELLALYVNPDVGFDPSTMDDTFGGGSTHGAEVAKENVLCSTDLGLLKAEKVGKNEWTKIVLLKPRIVLQSRLDEIGQSEDIDSP